MGITSANIKQKEGHITQLENYGFILSSLLYLTCRTVKLQLFWMPAVRRWKLQAVFLTNIVLRRGPHVPDAFNQ
jgi:hypothetical protein